VYAFIATLAAGVLFKHLSPFLVNTSLVIFHMYFIVVLSMLSYLIDFRIQWYAYDLFPFLGLVYCSCALSCNRVNHFLSILTRYYYYYACVTSICIFYILWCFHFLAYERQNTPVLYVYIYNLNTGYFVSSVLLLAFRFVTAFCWKLAIRLLVATNMRERKYYNPQNTRISATFNLYFSQDETRHSSHR